MFNEVISQTNVLIFSLLGGILPALFWVWFWIREDRLRPEPKSALLSAFLGGILAVMLALFLELVIYFLVADAHTPTVAKDPTIFWDFLQKIADKNHLVDWQINFWSSIQDWIGSWNTAVTYNLIEAKKFFLVVVMSPIVEELLKLFFAYNICLRRKVNDEPIDASIYLLTTALGFAAIETTLFLTAPLTHGDLSLSLSLGESRFMGAMLIHVIASAVIGIFIGLAFYKSRIKKFFYALSGLILAFILHAAFNFFMFLHDNTKNQLFFWIGSIVTWLLMVLLLVFFERVKKVSRPTSKK